MTEPLFPERAVIRRVDGERAAACDQFERLRRLGGLGPGQAEHYHQESSMLNEAFGVPRAVQRSTLVARQLARVPARVRRAA